MHFQIAVRAASGDAIQKSSLFWPVSNNWHSALRVVAIRPTKEGFRVHHILTDEAYGKLEGAGLFTEKMVYDSSSPYSASKASSDYLVRASHRTYGLPVLITNCSNNYGPYQYSGKAYPANYFECA